MNKKKMKQVVFEIMGVLISFLVLIPFLMVFLNSMKSKRQADLLQLSLTGISWEQFLENYGTVIPGGAACFQLPEQRGRYLSGGGAGSFMCLHGGICCGEKKNKGHEGGE